ncbi:MAG: type II toxin-antitoxin system RelE/ParE family toxin [Candidatus Omnitrophica bacterium]|nr:type II toxin-antitoxin system RelE/ParE family toxin [Candidatus Omnitrophota bacterium]
MANYSVKIKRTALKEIARLPQRDVKKIVAIIGALADDPRPKQAKKLSSQEKYRIRSGDYRILYEVYDNVLIVFVVKVAHRRNAYR